MTMESQPQLGFWGRHAGLQRTLVSLFTLEAIACIDAFFAGYGYGFIETNIIGVLTWGSVALLIQLCVGWDDVAIYHEFKGHTLGMPHLSYSFNVWVVGTLLPVIFIVYLKADQPDYLLIVQLRAVLTVFNMGCALICVGAWHAMRVRKYIAAQQPQEKVEALVPESGQ